MSYCRMNGKDSDVYFLPTFDGLECCACRLTPERNGQYGSKYFKTRSRARAHLLRHREAGHKVPESAIKRLTDEIGFLGDRAVD